jgi:uracil-DNA glycosylase family 4
MKTSIERIQRDVVACHRCPRLVKYLSGIREQYPDYWCKPVPGFGDPRARVMLLGLAPGRFGSNRTGRMFTGDASGRFLFPALHQVGWANQPDGENAGDGLRLKDVFITAAGRCAPPQNKPTPEEIRRCVEFVRMEIQAMPRLKAVVAMGKIAHDAYLYLLKRPYSKHPFKHGAVHRFEGRPALVDIYHPSRQNTQTGLLTMPMFVEVLKKAKAVAEGD